MNKKPPEYPDPVAEAHKEMAATKRLVDEMKEALLAAGFDYAEPDPDDPGVPWAKVLEEAGEPITEAASDESEERYGIRRTEDVPNTAIISRRGTKRSLN